MKNYKKVYLQGGVLILEVVILKITLQKILERSELCLPSSTFLAIKDLKVGKLGFNFSHFWRENSNTLKQNKFDFWRENSNVRILGNFFFINESASIARHDYLNSNFR